MKKNTSTVPSKVKQQQVAPTDQLLRTKQISINEDVFLVDDFSVGKCKCDTSFAYNLYMALCKLVFENIKDIETFQTAKAQLATIYDNQLTTFNQLHMKAFPILLKYIEAVESKFSALFFTQKS